MNISNPYVGERRAGSVGLPLPGVSTRIVTPELTDVAPGEIGELLVRGPNVFAGYWGRPEATAAAFTDGWFRTGDLAVRSDDGYYGLRGRRTDLIISGGFNIYPSDLEAELVKHEAVLEAAVVWVPSDAWGETPVAFVALQPGAATSPDELKAWMNAKVGKTQRLADLQLVDSLPRSHIGKILKRELRDAYEGPAKSTAKA
jgi:acyl-CoA synthetase (AMP-forming)/AMP-acid ligase II